MGYGIVVVRTSEISRTGNNVVEIEPFHPQGTLLSSRLMGCLQSLKSVVTTNPFSKGIFFPTLELLRPDKLVESVSEEQKVLLEMSLTMFNTRKTKNHRKGFPNTTNPRHMFPQDQ